MKISPAALLEHARTDEGRKQIRYAGVAAVFVPLGQAGVQLLKWGFGIHAVAAVFITACILTPPNYLANKHYVWKHKSKDDQAHRNRRCSGWPRSSEPRSPWLSCTSQS